jgi:hypothetical protein
MILKKTAKKVLGLAGLIDRAIVDGLSHQRRHRPKAASWPSGATSRDILDLAHSYDGENFERYTKVLKYSTTLRSYLWVRHHTLGHAKRLARRLLR